jgi:uncharacterized protein (TIGR00251 family)
MAPPFQASPQGVRIHIRATPKAARARVLGVAAGKDGRSELRIALTQPAEGGRANAELIQLLARALDLPKRDLTIVAGPAGRRKTVLIAGDARVLVPKLDAWLAAAG